MDALLNPTLETAIALDYFNRLYHNTIILRTPEDDLEYSRRYEYANEYVSKFTSENITQLEIRQTFYGTQNFKDVVCLFTALQYFAEFPETAYQHAADAIIDTIKPENRKVSCKLYIWMFMLSIQQSATA